MSTSFSLRRKEVTRSTCLIDGKTSIFERGRVLTSRCSLLLSMVIQNASAFCLRTGPLRRNSTGNSQPRWIVIDFACLERASRKRLLSLRKYCDSVRSIHGRDLGPDPGLAWIAFRMTQARPGPDQSRISANCLSMGRACCKGIRLMI